MAGCIRTHWNCVFPLLGGLQTVENGTSINANLGLLGEIKMNVHSEHSHLGDSIWCLNALHHMPGTHTLRCAPEYVDPLRELVAGTNIFIEDCSNVPPDSRNYWIASGLYERQGIRYQDNVDIMGFVQKYFNAMSEDGGFAPCFPRREDMVAEWPSLWMPTYEEFHGVLFINCDPKSGQCPRYSSSEMDALIERTKNAGHSVWGIEKAGLSLPQIGSLALTAKIIVGCATGPWWPTVNKWNKDTQRICLLDPMRLDYGSAVPTVHAKDAGEVVTIMERMGFL